MLRFLCILTVGLLAGVECKRNVTAKLNPGCDPILCKNAIFVHVKTEGENDTLHHLWDFTGKPTLLIALTGRNANLNIDWSNFLFGKEKTVKFDPEPTYVFSVILDKIIEFNDTDDKGYLNVTNGNSSYVSLLDTKYFDWTLTNMTNGSGDASMTVVATKFNDDVTNIKKNGTVQIVMSAFGGEAHGESLPHLLHSGNASQIDITMDGLSMQYKHARFGLSLLAISSDPANATLPTVRHRKTLDDEHAPGVFTIVELLTPAVAEGRDGAYAQWRPTVYTSAARDMTASTETAQYSVEALADPDDTFANTLVASAFGPRVADMLALSTNITFGVSGDGFYQKNEYIAWTVVIGYGQPPEEHFSMLVALVLAIGLGVPAILILTGTICIIVRRLQRNKDDFFLSR